MPPVVQKRYDEVSEKSTCPRTKFVRGPEPMMRHPTIPRDASEPNRAYLEAIQKDGANPPSAHNRPTSARSLALDYYHQDRCCEHNPKNDHRSFRQEEEPTFALTVLRRLT